VGLLCIKLVVRGEGTRGSECRVYVLVTGKQVGQLLISNPKCAADPEGFNPYLSNSASSLFDENRHLKMVVPGKSLPNGQLNNIHRDDARTSNL